MKKTYYLILLGMLLSINNVSAQHLIEALDAPVNAFIPSEKCLELVKDKHYGDGDHNFVYCAVQGPNGKKWLNLNLGAEYAKEGSPHFNPKAQPTGYNDWKAFGSLFQDGRKADGHELVDYYHKDIKPSSLLGNISNKWWYAYRKYPIETIPQDHTDSNHSFVYNPNGWMANRDNDENLWAGEMINNPCPNGYRVMNERDIRSILVDDYTKVTGDKNQGYTTPSIFWNKDFPNLTITTAPLVDISYSDVYFPEKPQLQLTETFGYKDEPFEIRGTSGLWMLIDRNAENVERMYIYNYVERPLGWRSEYYERPQQESYYWQFDRGFFGAGGFNSDYGYQSTHIYKSMAIRCVEK